MPSCGSVAFFVDPLTSTQQSALSIQSLNCNSSFLVRGVHLSQSVATSYDRVSTEFLYAL